MNYNFIVATVSLFFYASSLALGNEKSAYLELRSSGVIGHASESRVAFRTRDTIRFFAISKMKQRSVGTNIIYSVKYEVFPDLSRAELVVYSLSKANKQPDQVFILHLKDKDWTEWNKPDYVETNAVSNLRFGYVPRDRSTNIPVDHFQLRYKVK